MLYLFDIDGTLLLSGGAGKRALERVFLSRYGLPDAMDGISPNGLTDPIIVEQMFLRLGREAEAAEITTLIAEYEQALAAEVERSSGFRLMPSARETVTHLHRRGAPLALATGNTREGARIKMERADLWRYFPCGGFGSDSRNRAELVQIGIDRARACYGRRFAPAEVLVIGDTPHDIAAARAVGAKVAAVATGGHSVESLSAADEVYPSLAEMLARLM